MTVFAVRFMIADRRTASGSFEERFLSFVDLVKTLANVYSWDDAASAMIISNNELDTAALEQTLKANSLLDPATDEIDVLDLIKVARSLASMQDERLRQWMAETYSRQPSRLN